MRSWTDRFLVRDRGLDPYTDYVRILEKSMETVIGRGIQKGY